MNMFDIKQILSTKSPYDEGAKESAEVTLEFLRDAVRPAHLLYSKIFRLKY